MSSGGKSGGSTPAYNYYGTLAGGVNFGPNDALVAILINSEEVWPKGIAWAVGMICKVNTLYVFDAQSWTCSVNHVATDANAPGSGQNGWVEYAYTPTGTFDDFSLSASDGTFYGTLRFYWGTNAQTVDDLLQATGNDAGVAGNRGNGDQHPDYQGLSYVVIRDFLLGQRIQSGPNIEIVTRRKPNQSIITGAPAGITDGQANLAAVAVELLTNENCLALPATMIDATSFQVVADWLQTNQALYGASVLIDSSETVTSLFDKLTQMFDGYVRFNPATKKIELGVYKHGVPPASFVTLTADSFVKFPKFAVASWQETISRATVRYNSRQLNYQQTSVQADDARATFVLGGVREQSLDRPWITRAPQAQQHGMETLRVVGHAQMTGELEVRREIGRNIRAGDYVRVNLDLEPNDTVISQFFRVTQKKLPRSGPVTLSVMADNALGPVPYQGSATAKVVPAAAVPPITHFRFLEVTAALSGNRGMIICLAQRPSNLFIGTNLYFDTNPAGTFSMLGSFLNFAAQATLAAPVAATDDTLHLIVDTTQVDADYFTQQYSPNDAANDTMLAFLVAVNLGQVAEDNAGFQIMEICSVGTQNLISAGHYDLSVLRGRKDTRPIAFDPAATEVWLMPAALLAFFTNNLFDTIRANRTAGIAPAVAQFRLCPYTTTASLTLSNAGNCPFQFPLKSPSEMTLTLTAPASYSLNFTAQTVWPLNISVAGVWADPVATLVRVETLLRKSDEPADRSVASSDFAATDNYLFSTSVAIEQPGNYTIKLVATDASGTATERDISVTVAGTGSPKCALVRAFSSQNVEIHAASAAVNLSVVDIFGGHSPSALPTLQSGGQLTTFAAVIGPNGGVAYAYHVVTNQMVSLGAITLLCTTPGATIYFQVLSALTGGYPFVETNSALLSSTLNTAGEAISGAGTDLQQAGDLSVSGSTVRNAGGELSSAGTALSSLAASTGVNASLSGASEPTFYGANVVDASGQVTFVSGSAGPQAYSINCQPCASLFMVAGLDLPVDKLLVVAWAVSPDVGVLADSDVVVFEIPLFNLANPS